ncbi:nectin-4 isoform X2 [Syngnathoides biaculeatus]|uniref:nectin-4 isoform X2 n=1 Tax=Syngnathoides biaculeatus TaxID=300417 RepID=UPI002ADD7457|nr:nectin-4 isoform X2 [Syngnathoides biaculeatus]
MRSLLAPSLCLLVSWMSVTRGEFAEQPREDSLRALAEEETVLPCRFQPTDSVVVQVTWSKETREGWEQIVTAHHIDGQTAFGTWAGRARFKSSDPTVDSSLVLLSTEVSDEGRYRCHVNSYPSGTFDREVTLTVWTIPISSLDAVTLVEGQSYRLAASCRSLARPPALLSWDTELSGQSVNRTWANGAVAAHYSLHPLRSMNGKRLDCLVRHPTLAGPRRHQNKLVVHFPPDPKVWGYDGDWYVGLEHAALRCVSGGNPKPQLFTWARLAEALPEGAIPHPNGTLEFGRPLGPSDGGTYRCTARNEVGAAAAELQISVTESPERQTATEKTMMVVVGVVAGGLLILMLVIIVAVTCHQKKKNKMLKRELTEKRDEISTLSRQASFRRMNSVSTDARGATEESIPLRVEGTLSSLGEPAHSRESHSSLSGGRWAGGEGAYDDLGRPVPLNSREGRGRLSERHEESRLRVETYVRNNGGSAQGTRLPAHVPTPSPVLQRGELLDSRPASAAPSLRRSPSSCSSPPETRDDDDDDEGLGGRAGRGYPGDRESRGSRSQVSGAHGAGYGVTNGTGSFKSGTVVSPHASLVHKAQIV